MEMFNLKNEEKAVLELRSLYKKYGYMQYKMSKFEEYDLYVRNKDFLVSDHIITFNDTNGKLMALKPDVTLSIIKKSGDQKGGVEKYYYNENVYRVSGSTKAFKEIMQTGLECIGEIDAYNICETVLLAVKSLASISEKYILDISQMDIIEALLEELSLSAESVAAVRKCIGEKNLHELTSICAAENADAEKIKNLAEIVSMYGTPQTVLPRLRALVQNEKAIRAAAELEEISTYLQKNGLGENIRIDFSVVHDIKYYNGIVFKGFVEGIPGGILSGGQYNNLMRKMGKKSGAIGFAVYLDMLQRLQKTEPLYDVDVLLLYEKDTDVQAVSDAVKLLTDTGKSVSVQRQVSEKIRYKQLLRLHERGLEILENNA